MAVDRSEWADVLGAGAWTGPAAIVTLDFVLGPAPDGASDPVQGVGEDGRRYFIKPLNNSQSPRVTLNEYVLGRMGRLIEAPVCEVAIVEITDDLAGYQFCLESQLEPGLAVGSLEVPNALPLRRLEHRADDDNRRRHAGVFAFFDWCWGDDDQWIYEAGNEYRVYSHDHGAYLPGGSYWTIEKLEEQVDEAHQPAADTAGLDVAALEQYADRLSSVTADEIRGILSTVPQGWDVEQEELEGLGWFLHRRARPTADRLTQLASSLRSGGQQ